MITYKEAIKKLTPLLKNITHIPKKEVEILLLHLIKKNVIWLYLNEDKECSCFNELESLVKKRAQNYPLEYITNQVTFFGEIFKITKGVLIPRPETELLVEKVIEKFKDKKDLKIIEIGVGSGIISAILAKNLDCKIIAVDINKKALNLAKENFILHKVEEKIELIESDLFNNVKEIDFDICISNPPYIAKDYKLPKNVTFEPTEALIGGEKGDEILKQIIDEVFKRDIKFLACEMGYDQKDSIEKFLKDFKYKSLEFYKDYSGFDRGFLLEIK